MSPLHKPRTRPDRLSTKLEMTAAEYIALIAGKLIRFAEVQRKDDLRTASDWARAIKGYKSSFD